MSQHPGVLTVDRPLDAQDGSRLPAGLSELKLLEPVLKPEPPVRPDIVVKPQHSRRPKLRTLLLAGVGAVAIAASGYFGWQYWTVGRFDVSTDDAYVKADNATIAPKVSGYIAAVLVGDNEPGQGRPGARPHRRSRLQGRPRAGRDGCRLRAGAAIASKQAALDAQHSVIEAARATVAADQADATFAEQEDQRYARSRQEGYGSRPECAAAPPLASPRAERRSRGTRLRLRAPPKQLDVLQGRARAGAGGARP